MALPINRAYLELSTALRSTVCDDSFLSRYFVSYVLHTFGSIIVPLEETILKRRLIDLSYKRC